MLTDADARETQRRFELGSASRVDVQNAQLSASSLAASLPGMRQQWLATRHALAVLLGRSPDQAPVDLELTSLTVPDEVPVVVPSTCWLRARTFRLPMPCESRGGAGWRRDGGFIPEHFVVGVDGKRWL